jgi:hypothetical protein
MNYDVVTKAIEKNEYCVGIFIDLSKAFDTLDHDILLQKLNFYGIRGIANKLMASYLANRKQYVIYNSLASSTEAVQIGVPQGAILGPLLFLLYINDIDSVSSYLLFLLFADDTNLLYSNTDANELFRIINLELKK